MSDYRRLSNIAHGDVFPIKKVIMVAKETVSLKRFKKWPFNKYFDYKLDDDNRIEEIKCIPCSQKWSEIVAESKKRQICGSVLGNIIEYLLPNRRIPLVLGIGQ